MSSKAGAKEIRSERSFHLISITVICFVIALVTFLIWPASFKHHLIISMGFGYGLLACLVILINYFPNMSRPFAYLVSGTVSVIISIAIGTANAYFWESLQRDPEASGVIFSILALGVVFVSAGYMYFYINEKNLVAEAEVEKLKRSKAEDDQALLLSQLSQLQSQIVPHFLFNTLANIQELIESDSVKANLMLSELTKLLRASLVSNKSGLSTVDQEISLISAYLSIQKIRLGNRLGFTIECEGHLKFIRLPPYLVQPIVENAISHGVEPKVDKGLIYIRFFCEGDFFVISTRDNGPGLSSANVKHGRGIGLSNVRYRLKKLFGDQADLTIAENSDEGITAKIVIPLIELANLSEEI